MLDSAKFYGGTWCTTVDSPVLLQNNSKKYLHLYLVSMLN